jgi:hypothetical protein
MLQLEITKHVSFKISCHLVRVLQMKVNLDQILLILRVATPLGQKMAYHLEYNSRFLIEGYRCRDLL